MCISCVFLFTHWLRHSYCCSYIMHVNHLYCSIVLFFPLWTWAHSYVSSLAELIEWTTHVHTTTDCSSSTCETTGGAAYPSLLIVDDFDKYLPLGQVRQLLNTWLLDSVSLASFLLEDILPVFTSHSKPVLLPFVCTVGSGKQPSTFYNVGACTMHPLYILSNGHLCFCRIWSDL